jgi:uncharacterized protein YdhG (YjbR/CyaY superfamily)
MKAAPSIEAYIAAADPKARPILKKIRRIVRKAAPSAAEVISYSMPAFRQNGVLLYFAAFKGHIGMYPPIAGDKALEKALAPYRGPKGNLQFPLSEPIPYDLIGRIAALRVKQDAAKAAAKRPK